VVPTTTPVPEPTAPAPTPTTPAVSPVDAEPTTTATPSPEPAPPTPTPEVLGETTDRALESEQPEPTEPITEDTDLIVLERGAPIPIDIDCDGTVTVSVNGGEATTGPIDTSGLDPGDHDIEVRCDDETVIQITATVFDQNAGAAGTASSASVVIMFVMLVGGVVALTPASGAGALAFTRRR
jgi:hypothetical protein